VKRNVEYLVFFRGEFIAHFLAAFPGIAAKKIKIRVLFVGKDEEG
jgi:hypothetical protein